MEAVVKELFHGNPWLLCAALALDLLLGDPVYPLHPIRLMGRILSSLENGLRKVGLSGYGGGILLGVLLSAISLAIYLIVDHFLRSVNPWLGFAWELFLLYSLLALGDLFRHVNRVAKAAALDDVVAARFHLSRLVGRDTSALDGKSCCRAAIESLSESALDGVWSALFWYALLGMPGLILFKVSSTMDSMVGYRDERYLRFGWFGARWDDVMNYVPARLSWIAISLMAFVLPGFSGRAAWQVGWRQHNILPSPNSGWPEAATAGALRLRLVGPIYKLGKLVTSVWLGRDQDPEGATPGEVNKSMILIGAATIPWLLFCVRWLCRGGF